MQGCYWGCSYCQLARIRITWVRSLNWRNVLIAAPPWWSVACPGSSPDKKCHCRRKITSPFVDWPFFLAPWDNFPCGCTLSWREEPELASFRWGFVASQKTARLLGPGFDFRSSQPCGLSDYSWPRLLQWETAIAGLSWLLSHPASMTE